MGRRIRKANDMLTEFVIELVHEYQWTIEARNRQIDHLNSELKESERMRRVALKHSKDVINTLGEVAEIIAGITEHTEDGDIKIYLSNIMPENKSKLERLFKLLDIPMTAEQIKEGDDNVED